jgi:hypothetical protein
MQQRTTAPLRRATGPSGRARPQTFQRSRASRRSRLPRAGPPRIARSPCGCAGANGLMPSHARKPFRKSRRPLSSTTASQSFHERDVAEIDTGQRGRVGANDQADLETRVAEAQLDLGLVEHEPEGLLLFEPGRMLPRPRKSKRATNFSSGSRSVRTRRLRNHISKPASRFSGRSSCAVHLYPPGAERLNDRPKLLTRRGRMVVVSATVAAWPTLDDAGLLERGEPLDKEVAGDARQAVLQLAEPVASEQELAEYQRRPTLGEDLGTQRDRAELPISLHGTSSRSNPSRTLRTREEDPEALAWPPAHRVRRSEVTARESPRGAPAAPTNLCCERVHAWRPPRIADAAAVTSAGAAGTRASRG